MSSITATSTNIQALLEKVELLQQREADLQEQLRQSEQRNHVMREDVKRAEQRNYALQAELDYQDRLNGNSHISPAQKLTLLYARRAVRVLRVDQHTMTEVHLNSIAKQVGLSARTCGRDLRALDEAGAIEYKTEPERLDDGTFRTHSYVAMTDLANYPEDIRIERNHGGKRVKRCEHCGSDDLWIETSIYCRSCQNRVHHSLEPLNAPLEAETDELSHSSSEPAASSAEIVNQDGDSEQIVNQDGDPDPITESVPIMVQPRGPAKPLHECRFCHVRKWLWSPHDDGWICFECYSPAEGEVRLL